MRIKIIISKSLRNDIYKKFKKESLKIYNLIETVRENPYKGKYLGKVSTLIIKELKYKNFRLYYLIDENKLILFKKEEIEELLVKFIALSTKNDQQKTINKIKLILERINQ